MEGAKGWRGQQLRGRYMQHDVRILYISSESALGRTAKTVADLRISARFVDHSLRKSYPEMNSARPRKKEALPQNALQCAPDRFEDRV